jgi:Fe-S cluster assembly protein SufD
VSHPARADAATAVAEPERKEPRAVRRARRDALQQFDRLGYPTTRNEDWRFTSVQPIVDAQFRSIAAPGGEVTAEQVAAAAFGHPEWPTVVFVNGRHAPELSSLDRLPAGVRVVDLATALDGAGGVDEVVERHLAQVASGEAHAFTALNTALMHDGAVVHVAADARAPEPIHLVFVSDALAAEGAAHLRNLVVLERHAAATVIESYVAVGDARYFTNAVTEAVVADGATLTHYKIQRESERAFHVGTLDARQARDSHFVSFSFATGAALSRTNVYTRLGGPGCGATLNGLYMADGTQHVDHQTRIEHVEPNCYSRELYKGVLDGQSHGVFNGKVYVHPEAQQTDGKQTNNTLLLSPTAQIDTKPQLEIFADDVKCTHGATVGRLDATSMFYMQSRGIDADAARRLLTYAFAADVLETLELAPVKVELERLTLERFAAGEGDAAATGAPARA